MSNPSEESQKIDPQELAYRKRCLNDFRRFSEHIPQHLSATLDAYVAPEGRSALLEVLILAVQAGRLIELEDVNVERARMLIARSGRKMQDTKRPKPSSLLKGLLDVNGRELRATQNAIEQPSGKPVDIDIMVAPGFVLPTKH